MVNWSLGIDGLQYISAWYKRSLVNYVGKHEVCRLRGRAVDSSVLEASTDKARIPSKSFSKPNKANAGISSPIWVLSGDRLMDNRRLTRDYGLVSLEYCMEVDQLSDRKPAQLVQQLLLRPAPAEETTHCPGCCELLYLQAFQEILLCPSPHRDQVHQFAHDHPIGYHKPSVEGGIPVKFSFEYPLFE